MEILLVTGSPYEGNKGEVINLKLRLEKNETISKGDLIKIEMMNDTFIETEVKIINPEFVGDYAEVSEKVKKSGWKRSENPVTEITGECVCDVVIKGVPYHEIKTDEEINRRAMIKEIESRYCLTPYKEIHGGNESIYDYVKEGYSVPDKVLEYLGVKNFYMVGSAIYKHPFKPEINLLGISTYSDGYYYWDSNTAEYVSKYGLILPEEFISHVMSDKGTEFIETFRNKVT